MHRIDVIGYMPGNEVIHAGSFWIPEGGKLPTRARRPELYKFIFKELGFKEIVDARAVIGYTFLNWEHNGQSSYLTTIESKLTPFNFTSKYTHH